MNITLTTQTEKNEPIEQFEEHAWADADQEHFGKPVDFTAQKFYILAESDHKLYGLAKIHIKAGSCRVDELIVDQAHQKQGIGRQLMTEVEKIARHQQCHVINLLTGKKWSAVGFYHALGFRTIAELPNYYAKQDWLELARYLA